MSTALDKAKALWSRFVGALKPIEFRGYEMLIMRIVIALLVLRLWPGGTTFSEQPMPVGLARIIDFTFLTNPAIWKALSIGLYIALAIYCSGRLLWLALPFVTFCVLAIGTLDNSQGADQHSTQIVALCLCVQCGWHIYAAIAKRHSRLEADRLGIWFMQQAIAAAYIVSALSKWIAKGHWVKDSYQFPLQVMKSQDMSYYNDLQPVVAGGDKYPILSDLIRPIASWMESVLVNHPAWAPLLIAPGFFLELFAFLLLAGRRMGAFIAASLIFFHLTVAEMMGLNFKFNIFLLAALFLSIPYCFEQIGRRILGKKNDG